jgi:hypothetical protein
MSTKRLRKVGDIMLDIEPLLLELTEGHSLQWAEVLSLVHGYLQVHCPDAREEYEEGGHPVFYYGYGDKT